MVLPPAPRPASEIAADLAAGTRIHPAQRDLDALALLDAILTAQGGAPATLETVRDSGSTVTIPANVRSYSFAILGTTGTVSDGTDTFPVGYSETVAPHANSNLGNSAITLTATGAATISATWTLEAA